MVPNQPFGCLSPYAPAVRWDLLNLEQMVVWYAGIATSLANLRTLKANRTNRIGRTWRAWFALLSSRARTRHTHRRIGGSCNHGCNHSCETSSRSRGRTSAPSAEWQSFHHSVPSLMGRGVGVLEKPEWIHPPPRVPQRIPVHARPVHQAERVGLKVPPRRRVVVAHPVLVQAGF